ncbi:unnamed protein product [Hymenolepis diminuta]|uniref:Uncharacterized protein n=1 Tax=Hymenolepis diminuta TaxID=6216 RepID=A0A564Y8U1_HYMDI|nr:unnamed protein product [Hymenolepis diminuta]
MPPDISNTSKTNVSVNSSTNSIQCPVGPVSPKVFPTVNPVEAAKNNMISHLPDGDSVKIICLSHSMESSMTKVVSKPTVRKQQSVPASCLLYHQRKQICCLKGHKEGCCTLPPPELINRPSRSSL